MTLPSPLRTGLFLLTAAAVGGIVFTAAIAASPKPFTASPVPALAPDASRTPVIPTVHDKTVFGAPPPGTTLVIPTGLTLPLKTNAWWSSGQLEAFGSPVYAWPLTAGFSVDGMLVDAPGRRTQDKTVFADPRAPLRIFTAAKVQSAGPIVAGDFDVTFRARAAGGVPLFDATLTQGSPFVFIRSTLSTLSAALPPDALTSPLSCTGVCGSALLVRSAKLTYVLASPAANAFTVQGGVVQILMEGNHRLLTVIAVAPGSDPSAYLDASMHPFVHTTTTFSVTASAVQTTFTIPVQTIVGVFLHQQNSMPQPPGALIGSIDTLRGPVNFYAAKSFSMSLPRPSVIPALPPASSVKTDPAFHKELADAIASNAQAAGDVYFAGKDLLRISSLAELADAAGDIPLRTKAVAQARAQLADWCTATPGEAGHYFAYDPVAGGVIAYPVGFGSEHYNDHHFHYGYFLQSAAIVARYDSTFDHDYGDCLRLLVRDIASTDRNDPSFPTLRYFDAYAGHSWAGGITKFGDGDNEESSSEAAHAWYALALYGRTVGDASLERLGTWMFAMEAHDARTYWFNAAPAGNALPAGFPFPMVSILWGGKADYATFFDAADAAVRGIQFFPMTPGILPFLDQKTVSRIVLPILTTTDNTIWRTAMQLVASFYTPVTVPADAQIDNVYSRAAIDYWMKSAAQYGQPVASAAPCAGEVFQKGTVLTAGIYRFPQDPASCTFMVLGHSVTVGKLTTGWNVLGVK